MIDEAIAAVRAAWYKISELDATGPVDPQVVTLLAELQSIWDVLKTRKDAEEAKKQSQVVKAYYRIKDNPGRFLERHFGIPIYYVAKMYVSPTFELLWIVDVDGTVYSAEEARKIPDPTLVPHTEWFQGEEWVITR